MDNAGEAKSAGRLVTQDLGQGGLAVRFLNSISAKVVVWLAAVLVPAETLPLMACDCGSHSPRPTQTGLGCTAAASVTACQHCNVGSRARHSCCGSAAASSASPGSCCAAKGSCSCCSKDGARSPGGPCQCSANDSAPAPAAPLPGDSRTDNTKSSVSTSSFGGLTAVVILVPSAAAARADQQPTLLGSTVPERLSVLCRLVI